jgi:pimeloyl-ACP methyl ester carboxylesterase
MAVNISDTANTISPDAFRGQEPSVTQPRTAAVTGHGGVRLHVCEYGPPDAQAILFVHGWSQCYLCWKFQLGSDLAARYRLVAFDLRGHGMSATPAEEAAYTRSEPWAGDVAAVIEQRGLDRPLVVGWSHGSFVVADYLRHHGDAAIRGVVLSSWAVRIGSDPADRANIGPGFEEHFAGSVADDLAANIAAMRQFVDVCVHTPLAPADRDEMLAYNMVVSPFVRSATGRHEACDNTGVLAKLSVPLLALHGARDTVVLPRSLDLVRQAQPHARFSLYPRSAHAPMLEEPERFNRELGDFALSC